MIINTLFGIEEIDSKVCRDCKEEKSIDQFEVNRKFYDKSSANGYREVRRPTCRQCRSKKKSINSSEAKFYRRPEILTCPICKDTVSGDYARLDHSHVDGSVRGWLCDNCNTALGKFKDSKDVLKRAINWLEGNV